MMKNLLLSALLLLMINHPTPAQVGSSMIGMSRIGADSLGVPAIGKAKTQSCPVPGPCGSACAVYTFIGTGNWDIEGNWEGNAIPPSMLTGCSQILIDPAGSTECILNIPIQIITTGTSIRVRSGKKLRIPGRLVEQ